jgi:hypothetical protein
MLCGEDLSAITEVDQCSESCVQQLAVQVVCDFEGYIIDYDLGWPGSVNDTTIFKESSLWLQRGAYFEEGEYLLVDKGKCSACSHSSAVLDSLQ